MNKAELQAITSIAEKMNWQHKPVSDVLETIKQMVANKQALELDCIGECDDSEETLLSIALWNVDKIVSCLYCWDYYTHTDYWDLISDMHISGLDFYTWMTTYEQVQAAFAEYYEAEEEFARLDSEFNDMDYNDFQYGVYMGWI